MIRNIIFDWSGTLVDDLPAVWRANNHVFERAGVEPMTLERFREEFELPFKPFYDRHTPDVSDEEREAWFHGHFPEVIHLIEELPHARNFLELCRRLGIRMAVFSAISASQFEYLCGKNGFGEYFEAVELGVRDKRERIADLLERHDLNPEETLFIGDMQHDVDAAKAGGVYACATLTGYNTLGQLRESGPHLIVEHLGELAGILERGELGDRLLGRVAAPGPVATVGGFVFDDSGKALFVKTHKWSGLWGMPGGKIRFGESSAAAFMREVAEETGVQAREAEFVLIQDCIQPPEFYRKAHFVLACFVARCGADAEVRLNDEARAFRWVSLEDAQELPLNGPSERLVRHLLERGYSQS